MYNNKEVIPHITKGIKINYNSILDKYTLLVPISEKPIINNNKTENMISLDPGLRTFMTGISENESVKIGNNVNKIIEKDIKRINKIKDNEKVPIKTKKKNEKIINRKIKNKVDDLHWKTANYLVKNYECILLGDMSAKGIVSKKSSILSNTQKVACLRTNYYVFSQRLAFKCKQNNVTFKLVDERYTSQTCSCCGNINKDLGGSDIYNCNECKTIIDRDINGARNIYIKSLLSKVN
jgi:putative transposase